MISSQLLFKIVVKIMSFGPEAEIDVRDIFRRLITHKYGDIFNPLDDYEMAVFNRAVTIASSNRYDFYCFIHSIFLDDADSACGQQVEKLIEKLESIDLLENDAHVALMKTLKGLLPD